MALTKVPSNLDATVATTQSASDNSTNVATTAYVTTALSNLVDSSPSALNTLNELAAALNDDASFSTTVNNSIATKIPLAGGTFTGNVNITKETPYLNLTDSSASRTLGVFVDDNNSVLRSSGQLLFQIGSASAITIDSTKRVGINQVPGANNFTLQVTGRLTDGTDGRAAYFKGYGTQTSIGSTGPTVVVQNANTTANNFAKLSFESGNAGETVSINAQNIDHSNHYGDMAFNTRGSGGYSEKARIKANGHLEFNPVNSFAALNNSILSSSNTYLYMMGGAAGLYLANNSGLDTSIGIRDANYIDFNTNSGEKMRLDSNGVLGIAANGARYASRLSVGVPPNRTPGTVFTSTPSVFYSEASLGNSVGDAQKIASFAGEDGSNVSGLAVYRYRRAAGTNWTGDGFSLRQEVDNTANIYDYINFANGKVGIGTPLPAQALSVAGTIGIGTNASVGVGGAMADANIAELGPGYLNLARDDTASARQIQFSKNGSQHSYIDTSASALEIGATSGLRTRILGNGNTVFQAGSDRLFSISSGTYEQGDIRQYVYQATVANGVTVDLFGNTSAHTDIHYLMTLEAFHSGRSYRTSFGSIGGYGWYAVNNGSGINFNNATVATGRQKLTWTNASGWNASVYISALIFGNNGVDVYNGALSELV